MVGIGFGAVPLNMPDRMCAPIIMPGVCVRLKQAMEALFPAQLKRRREQQSSKKEGCPAAATAQRQTQVGLVCTLDGMCMRVFMRVSVGGVGVWVRVWGWGRGWGWGWGCEGFVPCII